MEDAEAKLVEELEEKYEGAFDIAKEKFNRTFELIHEADASIIEELSTALDEANNNIEILENRIEELLDTELDDYIDSMPLVTEAIAKTEDRMRAEADERVEKLKENLVTSTEIFLEQELAEVKADKEAIMKETQGR
jgi:hypothetical protein